MSWRRRSRTRGSRSRPAGRPRRRRLATRGCDDRSFGRGRSALALAVSALAAPPIRTAVAKSRAAASARAAALARGEDGSGAGTRPPDRDGEFRARRGATRKSARAFCAGRDSLYAEGLIALGNGEYQNACASFERMRTTDSLDATRVVRTRRLPGARLGGRARREERLRGGDSARVGRRRRMRYVHAATLAPATNHALTYRMLSNLLPITPAQIRLGRSVERNAHSTSARIRRPTATRSRSFRFRSPTSWRRKPAVMSPSLPEALRRNRDLLVNAARRWTASFPDNPEAFEALAAGLEARGEIGEATTTAPTARSGERVRWRGRRTTALRLASSEVRLRIKRGELESAIDPRRLAAGRESDRAPSREQAASLVGLAALTGRVARQADFEPSRSRRSNADVGIAPPLTAPASRLFARAASASATTRCSCLRRHSTPLLESYSQPIRRAQFRRELITRPMSLAYPCFGAQAFDGLPPYCRSTSRERAALRGDRRRAAAILDSVEAVRRVSLARGDRARRTWFRRPRSERRSATRRARFDSSTAYCVRLPTLSQFADAGRGAVAAFGRAFLLRAELARATGHGAEQQLRARQALVVWRHADASFAPTIERLRVARLPGTIIRISGRGGRRPTSRRTSSPPRSRRHRLVRRRDAEPSTQEKSDAATSWRARATLAAGLVVDLQSSCGKGSEKSPRRDERRGGAACCRRRAARCQARSPSRSTSTPATSSMPSLTSFSTAAAERTAAVSRPGRMSRRQRE